MRGYPEIMDAEEAVQYLRARIGGLAPMAETLRQWSTPAWRERYADLVAQRRIPRGMVVAGTKKRAWSRAALDAYADTLISEVKAHDPVFEPSPGERRDAPA